ncbi:MAG: DUF1585 domain-containing protein [Lysobacterales bacterium]|nr:MAG: DUF1585 domain-containing protein [Xanthomonadales bacterium]
MHARWAPAFAVACAALALAQPSPAEADSRTQAKRIHDRLAGVPPTPAVLDEMAADVAAGRSTEAALKAMENRSFYDVTLKNFAMPWTNRDQTMFAPLNDYVATVIGMVRDDVPFNQVLSEDILYVGRSGLGLPSYSGASNEHYEALEASGASLKDALVRTTQSAATGLPPDATAGVVTTRAAAQAFFVAGTNRAMLRFTLMNHLCSDLEQLQDPTRPPDRIRQDVSRSPGGDSRVYLNNCIACHSGMDPLAQAYAYYDYDETGGRLVYSAGQVRPKYFNNDDTFRPGYVTPDDSWANYWRAGRNSLVGWDGSLPGAGQGAKSLGRELAGSDRFARCQVEKVFRNVCFRAPSDGTDRARVDSMTASFRANGYQLKRVFAEAATYCMGD